jgi:methionyl-tRNA formyltransferase
MNGKILFLGYEDSPLINWLVDNGHEVEVFTGKITLEFVKKGDFQYLISYGYRYIISKEMIEFFDNKGINLHISFLPWNKGADPNLWSFIENTKKGVTIHYLDEGLDTGDIIVQKEVEFDYETDTLSTSYNKLQNEIQSLFKKNWDLIRSDKCERIKQIGKGSYHNSKDKEKIKHLITKSWDTPISDLINKK